MTFGLKAAHLQLLAGTVGAKPGSVSPGGGGNGPARTPGVAGFPKDVLGEQQHSYCYLALHLIVLSPGIKVQLCYSLEKAMAPHSGTLAWKIPWMEEPGRLQSMGLLRVRHA